MVAINFTMFIDKIENGTKRQTVRSTMKSPNVADRISMGTRLQLYTGMRTKSCRKLGEVICKEVIPVMLTEYVALCWHGLHLDSTVMEKFAIDDGFSNYIEMWNFFKARANKNGEFFGKLIKW